MLSDTYQLRPDVPGQDRCHFCELRHLFQRYTTPLQELCKGAVGGARHLINSR